MTGVNKSKKDYYLDLQEVNKNYNSLKELFNKTQAELKLTKDNLKNKDFELQELKNIFDTVIETIPVRVFWKDKNLNYLGCNTLFALDAGKLSPSSIIGTIDSMLSWHEIADLLNKDDMQVMESGEAKLGYTEHQVKSAENIKWYKTSKVPLRNSENNIVGILGTYEDITERKVAEDALIKSEERFKTLSLIAYEGIMVHENGIILEINAAFAKLLGYSKPDDLIGKNGLELIRFTEESRQIVTGHLSLRSDETYDIEIYDPNGNIIPLETSGKDINYLGRNARLVYMRDITARKKFENALKESEEKYRFLLENMNEVVMMVDNDDRVKYVNKRFTEKFGYSPEEIIGKIGFEVLLDPEDHQVIINENKNRINKIYNQYEIKFKGKNGQKIDFLVSGAPIFDHQGNTIGSIGTMTDITEKKIIQMELEAHKNNLEKLVKERTEEIEALNEELTATNEELFQNNEELYSVNEVLDSQKKQLEETLEKLKLTQLQLVQSEKMASIGILTAGIAHEINNPVNFISSGITGLEMVITDILTNLQFYRELCGDNPECKKRELVNTVEKQKDLTKSIENISILLNSIHTGVERTTNIVRSLRTFSRLDNESKSFIDIHELIDSSLTILSNKLKDQITIVKEYGLKEIIQCYPGKLSQVFLNLLVNAVQSIKNTGTITIITRKSKTPGKIEILIRDTGKGMSGDIQQKIFDPFFTTKPVGEGTGMGLSIVHGIIKDHQGDIFVTSKEYQGTEFRIELPIN